MVSTRRNASGCCKRCANSNCEERLPPNASFSIDVRRSGSRTDRSPHPCGSGLRVPSNPSRKAAPSPKRRSNPPSPHRCCGNSLSMKVYPRWSTSRRAFGHEEEGEPLKGGGMRTLYQAFSDARGRAFSASYRSHPQDVPAAIAERRPTGNKPHSTSIPRSASAPTPPSARLEQAKSPPGTEEHPSGNATRTKERSQTNRTPNRSAARTGTLFAKSEAPSSSQLRSGEAALL